MNEKQQKIAKEMRHISARLASLSLELESADDGANDQSGELQPKFKMDESKLTRIAEVCEQTRQQMLRDAATPPASGGAS